MCGSAQVRIGVFSSFRSVGVMNRGVALRIPRLKIWQWGVLVLFGAGAAALGWLVLREVDWKALLASLEDRPLLFFSAMAVLPAVGAPMSPFYLGAGAAFPLPLAIGGSLAGMTANVAISYLAARWLLHPLVSWLARRLGYTIPQVPHEHRWLVTVLLRITPGPPFFMQHYLLALGRVPFGVYMAVSIPICGLMGMGAVAAGAGLTSGSAGGLVAGLCFLVAIGLGVRFARKAMQRRSHVKVDEHGKVISDEPEDSGSDEDPDGPRGPGRP